MGLLLAGLQYGTCLAARGVALYLGTLMGFFFFFMQHGIARAGPFSHRLESAQHPIPRGNGRMNLLLLFTYHLG